MWMDGAEIEFAGGQEDDGAEGGEAGVSARLALGGLEQAVDGFEEAIGLAGLGPGDDAVEMRTDHPGPPLHWLGHRAHHVAGPLREHGARDLDLLALHDVPHPAGPGTSRALGRNLRDKRIPACLRGQAGAIPHHVPFNRVSNRERNPARSEAQTAAALVPLQGRMRKCAPSRHGPASFPLPGVKSSLRRATLALDPLPRDASATRLTPKGADFS